MHRAQPQQLQGCSQRPPEKGDWDGGSWNGMGGGQEMKQLQGLVCNFTPMGPMSLGYSWVWWDLKYQEITQVLLSQLLL